MHPSQSETGIACGMSSRGRVRMIIRRVRIMSRGKSGWTSSSRDTGSDRGRIDGTRQVLVGCVGIYIGMITNVMMVLYGSWVKHRLPRLLGTSAQKMRRAN